MKFSFVGGSYQMPSLRADAERTLNLYPLHIQGGSAPGAAPTGHSTAALMGSPGLSVFDTLPTTPGRGIWAGEQRLFAVAGSRLYEIFVNGTHTDRGDVGNDGKPVQLIPNGNQLMIVSAGNVYIDTGTGIVQPTYPGLAGTCNVQHYAYQSIGAPLFDGSMIGKTITVNGVTSTVGWVSDPGVIPNACITNVDGGIQAGVAWSIPGAAITGACGTFLDGYFLVAVPSTKQFIISGINNGLAWNGLDFATKEGYPDNLLAVFADHEEVYLLGTQTMEVWRNTGGSAAAPFPLVRDPGAMLNLGLMAQSSVARLLGGIAMLSGDSRGGPSAVHVVGYTPVTISTPALERRWKAYATVADAVAFSYIDDGHHFYQINFPTGDESFVYDATEKLWHDRSTFAFGFEHRHRAAFHAFTFNQHFVQDFQNGAVYTMSTALLDDAGSPITRQRVAPHLSSEDNRTFFSRLQLDCEINPASGVAPVFTLEVSNDGGNTYGTPRVKQGGWLNSFLARVLWNRLGSSRLRTFRVTSRSAIKHVWTDAYYMGN